MIKYLKQIDKLLRDTFDYLGVPTLEDLDKHVSKKLKEIKKVKIIFTLRKILILIFT